MRLLFYPQAIDHLQEYSIETIIIYWMLLVGFVQVGGGSMGMATGYLYFLFIDLNVRAVVSASIHSAKHSPVEPHYQPLATRKYHKK